MQENAVYRYVARFGQGVFRLPRPMFGPHALLPRSARLVSRITATKFIPRLTARWNALSSTRWEMTAALPPYICAPCDLSAIVFGEADPPFAKRATVQTSWQSYLCARRGNS